MHGETMLADGPYRRTRNPLYLGTLLHTLGVTILMPPSGAVFAVVLLWIFQVRLALAEEPFLAAQFGQAYLDYKKAVPRFLPAPKPQIPSAGARPHWVQTLLGEIYFLAVFLVLAIFRMELQRAAASPWFAHFSGTGAGSTSVPAARSAQYSRRRITTLNVKRAGDRRNARRLSGPLH